MTFYQLGNLINESIPIALPHESFVINSQYVSIQNIKKKNENNNG